VTAVGVRLPDVGVLRRRRHHPTFDLRPGAALAAPFADRRPSGLALAHYGLLPDPGDVLAEAEGMLRQWAETAEIAYRAGEDIADALARRFDPPPGVVGHEHREKFEVMNGVHSNAAGFAPVVGDPRRPKKTD